MILKSWKYCDDYFILNKKIKSVEKDTCITIYVNF